MAWPPRTLCTYIAHDLTRGLCFHPKTPNAKNDANARTVVYQSREKNKPKTTKTETKPENKYGTKRAPNSKTAAQTREKPKKPSLLIQSATQCACYAAARSFLLLLLLLLLLHAAKMPKREACSAYSADHRMRIPSWRRRLGHERTRCGWVWLQRGRGAA